MHGKLGMIILDKNQKVLSFVLASAIFNRTIDSFDPFDSVNWNEIFNLSNDHQVTSLTYPVIKNILSEENENKLLSTWGKAAIVSALNQKKIWEEVELILSTLNSSKIEVLVIKGPIIGQLYPVPELRTFADLDILVEKKNLLSAESILNSIGYVRKQSDRRHIILGHRNMLNIELHLKLSSEQFEDKAKNWEEGLWKNKIMKNVKNVNAYTLTIEDNFLFICLHIANHIVSSGFGLRQLCDLAVFYDYYKNNFNWEYIYGIADEIGIKKFIVVLFNICKILFGLDIPQIHLLPIEDTEIMNSLIDKIFSDGVFGNNEIKETLARISFNYMQKQSNHSMPNNFLRLVHIIFPPYQVMRKRYEYINRFPVFLPVAWVNRILVNILRKNKIIHSPKDIKALIASKDVFQEKYKLLKWLELI